MSTCMPIIVYLGVKVYINSMFKVLKISLLVLLLVILLTLLYIFLLKKPSNSRNWEFGFEILPEFTIAGDTINISNLRDNSYVSGTTFKQNYLSRSVQTSDISRAWLVVSKFTGFEGVAHTYFVFDMKNSEPITVSVEARREKGEKYDIWGGLFNNFELMYIWATERDSIVRRTLISKDNVYMYPLELKEASVQKLFLSLADRSEKLLDKPRFYNTLTSNCTNELAKSANQVKKGTVPWNIAFMLPGYSASEMIKLGFIKGEEPFKDFERRHYITDFVVEHYNDENLTEQIRNKLGTTYYNN
jgi:hypothetical protein